MDSGLDTLQSFFSPLHSLYIKDKARHAVERSTQQNSFSQHVNPVVVLSDLVIVVSYKKVLSNVAIL